MSTQYVKAGQTITYTNTGSAIPSGAIVPIAGLGCGIAQVDIAASTGTGEVALYGVHSITRKSSDAFTLGQKVYYDISASEVVNVAADDGDVFIGYAHEAASAAAGSLNVALAPFSEQGARVITQGTATTVTADDLAGGTCTVVASAAGTQAVSLIAAASVPGAIFTIYKSGSAGAVTITPTAGTIAGAGTYAAADAQNDHATFQAIGTDWVLIAATLA